MMKAATNGILSLLLIGKKKAKNEIVAPVDARPKEVRRRSPMITDEMAAPILVATK